MSKEQIEEMAEIMRHSCEKECGRNKFGEFDCEYCEAELLYNAGYRKQSEWIPVSEPPKENGIYCVMVENHKSSKYKQRTHARYKNGRWLDLYDNWENRCWHVTHWMPLPEPPKGV